MANSMVWVPEGGMLQITSKILKAEAAGTSAEEIIYKITEDAPQFGNSLPCPHFFFAFQPDFAIAFSSLGLDAEQCHTERLRFQ